MAQELSDKIRAAAQAKGIDPEIALRIARAESAVNPAAQAKTSSAGGLFQVVDKTWREFGGKPGKKYDPDENIRVGTDIIAKNTQTLKSFLNRDPRPAEVYAAHYFGPTGAKSFLSAEPGTPMESIFSKEVIRANPNLKGKTTAQVMASLEKKMGGKPVQQAKASPSAEQVAPAPARAAGEPGARTVSAAPAAATVSRETVSSLGPGYQAALALSFLADTDEKEDRDIDREPGIAEKWLAESATASRPTALAEFSDISIKSPFAALEPKQPQMLADGGEVEEPGVLSVPTYSKTVSYEMYPGQEGQFDQRDAARHMLASGTLARKYGPTAAEMLGKLHEIGTSPMRFIGSKLGISEMPVDYEQDLHNNRIGIELGKRSKSQKDLEDLVQQMAEQAKGQRVEGKPWTGRPVKRADGSPEEGERLTPQQIERIAAQEAMEREAASRPATVNPNIQRQGEAARRLAAMRDVNTLPDPRTYAAVSGFLGQAPDELGFSVMHPDREGIKKAGEIGFGVGTALQVAPIVGGAMKLANFGPSAGGKATAASQLGAIKLPGKTSEPIFTPIPSAEAPFVGRLDEFVSGLPGPVQKDQFLGMLKGKMRDYDIARAETTLADLPGNAKLTPVDLLNRIKTQYDPSQFKTTVIPPGKPGEFYQSMDNPYIGSTKDGQPLGVIHLSQGMLPDAVAQQERLKEAGLALSRIGTSGPITAADPTIADDLLNFLQNPGVPLSDATAAKMAEVAQGFRKVAEFDQAWDAAKSNIMYPALNSDFWPTVNNYAKQLSETQGKGFYDPDVQSLATGMAVRDFSQKGNQWLVANGAAPIDLPDFTAMKDAAMHVSGNPDLLKAIRTGFDDARAASREALKEVKKEATEARRMFGDDTRDLAKYEGQHPSLKNPPSPISFSRFSEHTTEIPGIGKAEGIYVNELQSDLLDDLRKLGPKGGSSEKDEALVAQFRRERNRLEEQRVLAQEANQLDEADRLRKEAKMAEKKAAAVMGRILKAERGEAGMYQLPESFAGMETSPQVAQQLMVKNAINGAIQMGKQFVAFPGAESAQAQLYEKLGPNLKSVVKDLGPGFELRDVTLRDPDGKQLMHKAIVWGPDAAARVQKKGVPFKDGGAVERQTADHRKYL